MKIVTEEEARSVGAYMYPAVLYEDCLFVRDGGRGASSFYYFASESPLVRQFAKNMISTIYHVLTKFDFVSAAEYFDRGLNKKKVMFRKALKYYERLAGYSDPEEWCFVPDTEEDQKIYEAIMGRPYPTDYRRGFAYYEPATAKFRQEAYDGD